MSISYDNVPKTKDKMIKAKLDQYVNIYDTTLAQFIADIHELTKRDFKFKSASKRESFVLADTAEDVDYYFKVTEHKGFLSNPNVLIVHIINTIDPLNNLLPKVSMIFTVKDATLMPYIKDIIKSYEKKFKKLLDGMKVDIKIET